MNRMLDLRTSLVLAIFFCSTGLRAQSASSSVFAEDIARAHEIKPHRTGISVAGIKSGGNDLWVTLTVSPTGRVVRADPHGSAISMTFWPSIKKEVRGWRFTPFEKDGRPVTAIIKEYVNLLPPERLPKVHVPAPKINPDSRIVITLQRGLCLGTCAAYAVTLNDSGDVVFDGHDYVETKGKHTFHVDPAVVRQLAADFVSADFYSMDAAYHAHITDLPMCTLSISIDGKEKEVEDYVGSWVGMPSVIYNLEDKVDELAQSRRWIGNGGLRRR